MGSPVTAAAWTNGSCRCASTALRNTRVNAAEASTPTVTIAASMLLLKMASDASVIRMPGIDMTMSMIESTARSKAPRR